MVLSEYGIGAVGGSVPINRVLRKEGLLQAQRTAAGELLDAGASRAFAVSDHQVAHVYVSRLSEVAAVKRLLEGIEGIERVLDAEGKAAAGLDHPRSGELVAVSTPDRWFDYYYWLDDRDAPDFARTVDIHRKPGYDPVELLLDPAQPLVKLKVLWKLLLKTLGFRYLMNVISLDPSLVKGSHGRLPDDPRDSSILISSSKAIKTSRVKMTEVSALIEDLLA
jgi:predicted AlkP superfamily pyrophosphatase or phosphodiesterase